MKRALQITALALCLLLTGALEAGGWKEIDREGGVIVWQKEVPDRSLPIFRGQTTIKAPIYRVLAILSDFDRHCQWMHGCKQARLVKQYDDLHRLSYNRTDAPWPVTDRDVALDSQVVLQPEKNTVLIKFQGVSSPLLPPSQDAVRMTRLRGYYMLTALGANSTRVQYQVDADPGGSLPDWLVRSASQDIPHNTLTNLRKRAGDDSLDQDYAAFYKRWDPALNPDAPTLIPSAP